MADGKVMLDLVISKRGLNSSLKEITERADEATRKLGETTEGLGKTSKTPPIPPITTGLNEGLDKTNKKTKQSTALLGKLKGGAGKAGQALNLLGIGATGASASALALGGAVGVVAAGVAGAIKVGVPFEQQLARVQAISGATAEEMEKLKEKSQQLGRTTQKSATEVATAFKYMSQAGWDTEKSLKAIDSVVKLSVASGEDLALVSDIITDAITGFGLAAEDANMFADILLTTASASNTSVYEMGETFKYVATASNTLGFSVEDTALAIGLLANNSIKGSMAGTSLRGIFTRLATASGESKEILERFNAELVNTDGTIRPLGEVIENLRKGFSTLSREQQIQNAKTLVGQESLSGFLAIVKSTDEDVKKLSESLKGASGEVDRQADIVGNTVSGAYTEFKSALEGVGIVIYNFLAPALKLLLQLLTKVINFVSDTIEILGQVVKAVWLGTKATGKLIVTFFKWLGEKFKNLFSAIGNDFTGFLKWVVDSFFNLPKRLYGVFGLAVDFGKNLVKSLWRGIFSMFSWLKDKVVGFFKGIFGGDDRVNEDFGGDFETSRNISRTTKKAVPRITNALNQAKQNLESALNTLVTQTPHRLATSGITPTSTYSSHLTINFDKYISRSESGDEAFFKQAEFYRQQKARGKGGK